MSEIKVITAPSIYLVGRQTIDDGELSRFLADEGVESWETDTSVGGQVLAEAAGRICYSSYAKPRPGGNAGYLRHILEVGHGSVIEATVWNFIIAGVSRSFSHELVRSRAGWAYSQRSQRFCDEGELSAVVPPVLADEVAEATSLMELFGVSARSLLEEGRCTATAGAGLRWLAAMEQARRDYSYLADYLAKKLGDARIAAIERSREGRYPTGPLDAGERTALRKQAREAARSVLPNATATEIFVTVNARAARWWVEQRGDLAADAEIRAVACLMARILKGEAPNLFADVDVKMAPDGREFVEVQHSKV